MLKILGLALVLSLAVIPGVAQAQARQPVAKTKAVTPKKSPAKAKPAPAKATKSAKAPAKAKAKVAVSPKAKSAKAMNAKSKSAKAKTLKAKPRRAKAAAPPPPARPASPSPGPVTSSGRTPGTEFAQVERPAAKDGIRGFGIAAVAPVQNQAGMKAKWRSRALPRLDDHALCLPAGLGPERNHHHAAGAA